MKQLSSRLALVTVCMLASCVFAPITFAKTPYNALARKLPSNTTKGVYSETDPLKPNTQVSGTVWSKNGSTFIIHLPKDDAGYNVLFSSDTEITLNGKAATAKKIVKGLPVTVTGTLDTSTFTIKATRVELGKSVPDLAKPIEVDRSTPMNRTTSAQNSPKPETPSAPVFTPEKIDQITHTLKQGNRGTEVSLLQNKLVALGFLSKDFATGYYGTETFKAVKAFQKKHGLPPVGSVGAQTRKLLNS